MATCKKTSLIWSFVTPFASAPRTWALISCGRFSAESMARFKRLRVFLSSPGRPQISPQQYCVTSSCSGRLKSSAVANALSTNSAPRTWRRMAKPCSNISLSTSSSFHEPQVYNHRVSQTKTLSSYIVSSRYEQIPGDVIHEAKRALLNFVGCAAGGSREPAVETAIRALNPFSGERSALLLARPERFDPLYAAVINGISGHVFEYDDTTDRKSVV